MNTETKEYKRIVKKIGEPRFNDGDKVKSTMFDGVATVKGEPFYNGFVWMYYFNENEVGCGQEYLRSAYEWVAYNNIGSSNFPNNWKLFVTEGAAGDYVDSRHANEEWDFIDIATFKNWYPEINLVVSK